MKRVIWYLFVFLSFTGSSAIVGFSQNPVRMIHPQNASASTWKTWRLVGGAVSPVYHPSIVVDKNGKWHIVFSWGEKELWEYSNVNPYWSDQIVDKLIDTIIDMSFRLGHVVAADSAGKLHICYATTDGTTFTLKYANNVYGNSWSHEVLLQDTEELVAPAIAVDSKNKTHIMVMRRIPSVQCPLFYITNSSGAWTSDSVAYAYDYASMAIDRNVKLHLCAYRMDLGGIAYITNAPGSWQSPEGFDYVGGGREGEVCSIDVDMLNHPHMSYLGGTNADIKYATRTDTGWQIVFIDTGGYQSYDVGNSIKIDHKNKAHISYFHWSDRSLRYASNASGNWINEVVDNSGAGMENSIAVDKAGFVHISYSVDSGRTSSGLSLYYSTNAPMVEITNPSGGNRWTAGETDTIMWNNVWGGTTAISLLFSSDGGASFDTISNKITADSERYIWAIPDSILSAKCIIRILDASTHQTVTQSEVFKIKPYLLTRFDSLGNYVPYNINKDRWSFGNYSENVWPSSWYNRFNYKGIDPYSQLPYLLSYWFLADTVFVNAQSSDFPDWLSWVRTFGVDACYQTVPQGLIYNLTALHYWGSSKHKWSGSCIGMAVSNALAFERKNDFKRKFTEFPDFDQAISVSPDTNVIPVITDLYAYAYGKTNITYRKAVVDSMTPTQTLNILKRILSSDNLPMQTLAFDNNDTGGGAHEVLAYQLKHVSNISPVWDVYVYDNSYPDSLKAIIKVDTSLNDADGAWNPLYAWQGWGGGIELYVDEPAVDFLATAVLPKSYKRKSFFAMSAETLEVHNTVDASMTIVDKHGDTTGFVNNRVVNNISGSMPLNIMTGKKLPPYGYLLPKSDYLLKLSNFTTNESRAFFFIGNQMLAWGRKDARSYQTDRLRFDTLNSPFLSVSNPDSDAKSGNLLAIMNNGTEEKCYLISGMELGKDDSVATRSGDSNTLKVINYGGSKQYDLRIEYVSSSGMGVFGRKNIPLLLNSSQTIKPNWTYLHDSLLIILVDEGNDGTIDDTLKLQNELTGVHDHGALIPRDYRLYQNYPNPFNPVTTILFDLPKQAHVTLKIFNLLGQEIATLVNEHRPAGRYTVNYDVSNLPSGIYFYRLSAGDFVAIKKMVVIK